MEFLESIKNASSSKVVFCGIGITLIGFHRVDDMAVACNYTMGIEPEIFIKKITWGPSKFEWLPRKLMDSTKLSELGWKSSRTQVSGLIKTQKDF